MVARIEDISFFATPPKAIAPRGAHAPSSPSSAAAGYPSTKIEGVEADDTAHDQPDRHSTNPNLGGTRGEGLERSQHDTATGRGTPSQQASKPLGWRGVELFNEDVKDRALFEQDADDWRRWHAEELPRAFSKLVVHREQNHVVCRASSIRRQNDGRSKLTFDSNPFTRWPALIVPT